jgi:hypothetical protein
MQRSLGFLRSRGYHVEPVERWVPRLNVRRDLFHWIDLVAVHSSMPGVLGVQTTTGDHAAERLEKARGNPALLAWLAAGNRLVVHGWTKHKRKLDGGGWSERGYWELREIAVGREQIEPERGVAG